MYDLIVIGGGPAGIMAAIRAGERNKSVLLIEKNNKLGKKLLLTGGGRCNITNLKDDQEFIENLPNINRKFLFSALKQYNSYSIYYYILNLGVELKEEDHNRIFPESNKAMDILNALLRELIKNRVEIETDCEVYNVGYDNHFEVKTSCGRFSAKNVLIATGGKSMPRTGSTGDGYLFASFFDHMITPLYPTETPILSTDALIKKDVLMGLSLYDVVGKVLGDGKVLDTKRYDILFAHFGLTGPLALKLSQTVYENMKRYLKLEVEIDPLPDMSRDDIFQLIKNQSRTHPLRQLKNVDLSLPGRLKDYFLESSRIHLERTLNSLKNDEIDKIVDIIKTFRLSVTGVKSFEDSFVTGGGVQLDQINPKTMESKLQPGLYFAGEVMDLHGHTGGYNITIALTTGHAVGDHIN
jgi:predicted Rossmann fold flavoprotein